MSRRCIMRRHGTIKMKNNHLEVLGHVRTDGNGLTVEHHNQAKDITNLHKLDIKTENDKPQLLKVRKLHPKEYIDFT